uniref:Uncharacterized protein n=1 Tax=Glossina palpalis gambiensis TaxID=67801 RepID=A0A1B0B5D0_9MUSC
ATISKRKNWLNGKKIIRHEIGHLPFKVVATSFINNLVLKAIVRSSLPVIIACCGCKRSATSAIFSTPSLLILAGAICSNKEFTLSEGCRKPGRASIA